MNNKNLMYPKIYENLSEYVDLKERRYQQYTMLMAYLKKKIAGKSAADFFEMYGMDNCILYAVTEMTDLLIDDINRECKGNIIYGVCDRAAEKFKFGYKGYNILYVDDLIKLYVSKTIKKIVVCSVFHEQEVIDNLCEKGIRLEDIITVKEVIEWM